MRHILLIGAAALGLSACGGGGEEATANNDAMMTDMNATMPIDNMGDMNATLTNGDTATMNELDPATQNMVANDMQSNAADANLANGM